LIRNSDRHPNACTSTPPTLGPTAAANAPAALHTPIDAMRFSAGVSVRTIASEAGIIAAAAAPWSARATSSTGTLGDSAQTSDIAANPATPARNSVRRPIVSANLPDGASRAANNVA